MHKTKTVAKSTGYIAELSFFLQFTKMTRIRNIKNVTGWQISKKHRNKVGMIA